MNMSEMKKTRVLGGISEHMWGKQYHQQDRVYSGLDGVIAMCLTANIPGGSYLYLVEEKREDDGICKG